jgi:type IV pilus assembly protein PilE
MKRSKREEALFRFRGFTMIELMITVAVIAILAAVALPNYVEYVTRSRLVEAKTNLSDMRTRLEQYFLDNRKYPGTCAAYAAGAPPANTIYLPASVKNFAVTCPTLTDTTYTVQAQGLGFTFTIDQTNVRKTTAEPAGWTTSAVCWVSRKNGDC